MCESPLRGHICNSLPVISPLLIKIGELKSLGTGFLSELNVLNVNWPVVKLSLWHFTVLQATLHIAGACGLGQVVKARVERSIAADGRGRDNYVVVTTNTAGNGPTFPWRISGLGVHKHWWKCPQVTLKISSFGQHKHSWRQPDFPRKISSFGCCKFQGQRKNIQWCLAYKHWNADVNGSPLFGSPGHLKHLLRCLWASFSHLEDWTMNVQSLWQGVLCISFWWLSSEALVAFVLALPINLTFGSAGTCSQTS